MSFLALMVGDLSYLEDREEKAHGLMNRSVTKVFIEQPRLHRVVNYSAGKEWLDFLVALVLSDIVRAIPDQIRDKIMYLD